ncbi:17804_t:CDS:2, partial [Racocetra fulgida]
SFLWTVDAALSDPVIGTVIRSVEPPLSVDDILAVIFFNDEELEICAGSSLYHLTQKLKLQIRDDYLKLLNNLITKHPDLFPLERFTQDDVIPNNRLLRLYGFILPNNPHDSYDLVLTTHPQAPLYSQKVALFESIGLQVNSTFPLKLSDPLPLNVLQYLRIQRLSPSEISTLAVSRGTKDRISARNEAEILKALDEACENLLAGFSVSLEELEAKIASGTYQKGSNAWAAAHVSIGEQKILMATLQKAKELLALVVCANCGKANENNKRCGRCRKVVYCGIDCQKSHYKEHKVLCKTAGE